MLNLKSMSKIKQAAAKKKLRIVALSNSAAHVLKTEGALPLVNYLLRFLKGERQMVTGVRPFRNNFLSGEKKEAVPGKY